MIKVLYYKENFKRIRNALQFAKLELDVIFSLIYYSFLISFFEL